MLTTVVRNYPKITEDKSQANLRLALSKFDQKKISFEELEKTYEQLDLIQYICACIYLHNF